MKTVNQVITSAVCMLFCGLSSFASAPNESELKTFVKQIYESYLSDESKQLDDDFRALFSPSFVGEDVEVGLDGAVSLNTLDLDKTVALFSRYKRAAGIDITYTITSFHSVAVKGNTGVATFEVDFQLAKDGELISRGSQHISLIAIRNSSSWKVSYLNRLYVHNQVFKGNCYCEVYSQGASDFATFLTVPDGDDYQTMNDKFEIVNASNRKGIKHAGGEVYAWNKKNNMIYLGDQVIGKAFSAEAAISNVLKNVYSERCNQVIVKE